MDCLDEMLKLEADTFDDDDDSSTYVPDEISNGKQGKRHRSKPLGRPRKKGFKELADKKKKDPKVMHQCDQCNARYTSLGKQALVTYLEFSGEMLFLRFFLVLDLTIFHEDFL